MRRQRYLIVSNTPYGIRNLAKVRSLFGFGMIWQCNENNQTLVIIRWQCPFLSNWIKFNFATGIRDEIYWCWIEGCDLLHPPLHCITSFTFWARIRIKFKIGAGIRIKLQSGKKCCHPIIMQGCGILYIDCLHILFSGSSDNVLDTHSKKESAHWTRRNDPDVCMLVKRLTEV